MRAVPPPPDAQRVSLTAIADGLRYARSRPELMGTYIVDMSAMFFGMPQALFPQVAHGYGGAGVLGLLYSAPAAGALLASATSGWASHVHRHGRAVVLAAAAWGLGTIAFGFAGALWLALLSLAVAGGADAISGIFRRRIWNETIPDELRGRLASIEMISFSSGPLLGNVEAGGVASLAGVRFSIVSGGVLCVVGAAACALLLPAFWLYDAPRSASSSSSSAEQLAVGREALGRDARGALGTAQPSSPSRCRQPSHSQSSAAAAISGNAFSRLARRDAGDAEAADARRVDQRAAAGEIHVAGAGRRVAPAVAHGVDLRPSRPCGPVSAFVSEVLPTPGVAGEHGDAIGQRAAQLVEALARAQREPDHAVAERRRRSRARARPRPRRRGGRPS